MFNNELSKECCRYIFIGGIYPEHKKSELAKTEDILYNASSDILQKNIIKGLEDNINEHITLFNVYFLMESLKKACWVDYYTWTGPKGGTNYNLPYLKLKILSFFSKYKSIVKHVGNWINKNNPNGKTVVFVYPAYFPFVMALKKLKKKFNLEVCLIVADLPLYMGLKQNKSFYNKLSLKFSDNLFLKNVDVVDEFVLLTEKMNDMINKYNKPYTVVEGIASDSYNYKDFPISKKKTLLYSGAIQQKYGIPELLKAIELVEDKDAEFVFYGNGDAV